MAISAGTIKNISTAIDGIIAEDEEIQNYIAKKNAKEDRHKKREQSGKLYQLLAANQLGVGADLIDAIKKDSIKKIASKKLIENDNGNCIILINHGTDEETKLPIQRVIELPVYEKLTQVKGKLTIKNFLNQLNWTKSIPLAIDPKKIEEKSKKALQIKERNLNSLSKMVKQKWGNVKIEE